MKTYAITDLRGDGYLNPAGPETRSVGNITKIIIHHDAVNRPHDYDSVARIRSEAAGHYANLGPGLQYHFSIDNVGEIFWVRGLDKTLWHCGNLPWNRTSIAIKLDGYFHPPQNQVPTKEQYEALKQLLDWLCTQHPEFPAVQGDVYGHREASSTACPGDTFFPWVVQYRQSGGNVAVPSSAVYDWPSMQPSAPAPTPATPAPAPATPPTITINYRVKRDGKQIGAYTIDQNAYAKYHDNPGSLIFDQNGNDVTAQIVAKFNPPAPPPPIPEAIPEDTKPVPVGLDPTKLDELLNTTKTNNALLNAIKSILDSIWAKLGSIFK